jgi:hypothetical protein
MHKKAFGTLPFVLFIFLFFISIINVLYKNQDSFIEKHYVFHAAIKRAELEETTRKAGEEVVIIYKIINRTKPDLINADKMAGWKLLKSLIIYNINRKHDVYTKMSLFNESCFCGKYDVSLIKQMSQQGAKDSMLTVPINNNQVGSCSDFIDVFINSIDDINIILTKDNTRFYCATQYGNAQYFEFLNAEIRLRQINESEVDEIYNNIEQLDKELYNLIMYELKEEYENNQK